MKTSPDHDSHRLLHKITHKSADDRQKANRLLLFQTKMAYLYVILNNFLY